MDESDYEAAQILLELPALITKSESSLRLKWGATRERSSMVGPTPTTCEIETEKQMSHNALSPTSPFLFSHVNPKTNVSLKRKTEQYLKVKEELTLSKKIFKEEVEKIKSDYDKLKALNLKIKAAVKEMESTSNAMNHSVEESTSTQQQSQYTAHHQQPFIMDQMAHNIEISSQYPHGQTQNQSSLSSNGGGLFMINGNNSKVGPSFSFDLNIPLPLEESYTMEAAKSYDKRALAAQARQIRIHILRSKKTNNKLPKSLL